MAKIKYVRLTIDVFENEKIDHILSLDNGDTIFLIWFELFLKVKKKGTNMFSTFVNIEEPISKILSTILEEPEDIINEAIEELTKLEMLEIKGNEIKIIVPWLTNQYYRTTPEYIDWRTKVFERDGYVCQHCGVIGGKLNAHHILSFADNKHLRYVVTNGLTLCEGCHKSEHSRLRKAGAPWQM